MPHLPEWTPPNVVKDYGTCEILTDRTSGLAYLRLVLPETGSDIDEYQVVIKQIPVRFVTPKGWQVSQGKIGWLDAHFVAFVQQEWEYRGGDATQESLTASLAGTEPPEYSSWGNWTHAASGVWTYTAPKTSGGSSRK